MPHDSTHVGGPIVCYACLREVACDQSPPPKLASFSQSGHTLTDADVERAARRVVELLAEKLR